MRVRVQSYGNGRSKSAKVLANALGVLRIKRHGSHFRGKNGDVIVNWGKPQNIIANAMYLNPLEAVTKASNKLVSLETMHRVGISVPELFRELISPPSDMKLVARTTLHGHSGKGIVVGTQRELYDNGIEAPLYTKYIEKTAEYRVIVVGDTVIDTKIKKKKRDWEGERDKYVWNLKNGYVFVRNEGSFNCKLPLVAIEAVKALGLRYGAVDIIEDEHDLYVLEVNTAFGLEGTTTELVSKALYEEIDDVYSRR